MIEGYVGRPGTGKTYSMTARALEELKRGHRVFANYPIKGAEVFAATDLLDLPPGFIVLDEAHLWMSSRAFHRLPHSWLVKISQTRKSGWHLLWSAQHPKRLDKALRDNTHLLHWCHAWPNGMTTGRPPRFVWSNCYEPERALDHDPKDPKILIMRKVRLFSMRTANAYDTLGAIDASDHMTTPDVYTQASEQRKAATVINLETTA